jgi:phenylacetate-coenzyme A ligase PaaK-like adenylate-forming protein
MREYCRRTGRGAYDIYGLTEIYGPASPSIAKNKRHAFWDVYFYFEIINQLRGEVCRRASSVNGHHTLKKKARR